MTSNEARAANVAIRQAEEALKAADRHLAEILIAEAQVFATLAIATAIERSAK